MYQQASKIPAIAASMAYSSLVLLECSVSVVCRRCDLVESTRVVAGWRQWQWPCSLAPHGGDRQGEEHAGGERHTAGHERRPGGGLRPGVGGGLAGLGGGLGCLGAGLHGLLHREI